jgi:predicted house-cleaning noncanonical NTP pyrophosphatase (MazG superfamily)
LFEMLRRIGSTLLARPDRLHLEWVWSLGRLWIVQCDEAPVATGCSPFDTARSANTILKSEVLTHFRAPVTRDRKWQKLACVAVFQKLERFTTRLFVLADAKLFASLAHGRHPDSLYQDLIHLTGSPLVIRSDLTGDTTLSAPRTDDITDPRQGLAYLIDTCRWYAKNGIDFDDLCFIAHTFIPAAASAFAFATPSSSRVRIDALWGLPDGLQFCTHDSYELDTRGPGRIAKKLRYKRSFLSAKSQKWQISTLGPPHDWASTLTEKHLRIIAEVSRRVALAVKKPVQIMWFARLRKGAGHPDPLPWRYTTEDTPTRIHSVLARHFSAPPVEIRTPADVEALEATVPGAVSSVLFRPDVGFLRNEEFLECLAAVASAKGLRIELEGSPLHHAFYILSRSSAEVACIDPFDPRVERRTFQKLVRDKIPVRIQREGELATTVRIADSELADVLKAKLLEEALEVFHAGPESMLDEMADVLEVLAALARTGKWTMLEIDKRAEEKRKRVGGFGKALVLIETQEVPLIRPVGEGLFPSERSAARRPSSRWVVAAGRRPKTRIDRIVVPLVPPAPSESRGPARVSLPQQGIVIDVRYGEKAVELIFVSPNATSNPRQLALDLPEPPVSGRKSPM